MKNNNWKQTLMLMFTLSVFSLLLVVCALADPVVPGNSTVTLHQNKGSYPIGNPDTINVTAGNITLLNLSSIQQTFRWTGLYGNVSGTIKLGNSQSNVLYQWTAVGKYVYASTSNSIDWTSITSATVAGVLSDFYFLDNGSDNYSLTFDTTGRFDSEITGIIANAPRALTYNSTGSRAWQTYALTDGVSTIFTGQVNSSGAKSFSNETVNYQMIIPENGLAQNTLPTEYYLWVELV